MPSRITHSKRCQSNIHSYFHQQLWQIQEILKNLHVFASAKTSAHTKILPSCHDCRNKDFALCQFPNLILENHRSPTWQILATIFVSSCALWPLKSNIWQSSREATRFRNILFHLYWAYFANAARGHINKLKTGLYPLKQGQSQKKPLITLASSCFWHPHLFHVYSAFITQSSFTQN